MGAPSDDLPAGAGIRRLHGLEPRPSCDGQGFKRLLQASTTWFERHIAAVNALNVFPVPDGDTGTNMYLTLQAALQEAAGEMSDAVGAVAQAVAHGALMGARGNSGVILSQLFRGVAQALQDVEVMDTPAAAAALQQASSTAYKGVIRPVEGTILTVARHAASAGAESDAAGEDLLTLLANVVAAAEKSVEATPSLLPVLAEAGVVDAGGRGLQIILEGMLLYLRGELSLSSAVQEAVVEFKHPVSSEVQYGYDVQFLVRGQDFDVDEVRQIIDAMGDSALVVGDSSTLKVHVHTPEPGTPLNYGASLGAVSGVIIENMQEQYEEFVSQAPAALGVPAVPQPKAPVGEIAVVAVVPGDGLARVFRSLGAAGIVPGGQTMNPSTEDILKAVDEAPTDKVVILPNNKNVILAAQQAQRLSSRQVRVVPSKYVPQGISALLAFSYQADLDTNVESMEEALHAVRTGEVTCAVRSVRMNGVQIDAGQIIGLLDGELVCAGFEYHEVVLDLLEKMAAQDLEIVTLYYGDEVTEEEAQALAGEIAERYPEQEIEVVHGGQPHYRYILSGE